MRDPYHSDPWLKRGRAKWHDTQADKDGHKAAMRATRKKARRVLKQDTHAGW